MAKTLRPGDLLRDPVKSGLMGKTARDVIDPEYSMPRAEREAALARLPSGWRTTLDQAEQWPFVDPDVMLATPTEDFNDFPNEPENLPEVIPFSEFEPWGKMDEETDRDYELFSYFRASGLGRDFSKTARHFSITQPYVSRVANKHDWIERAKQWDLYREKIYTTEVIEETRKMAKDHAKIAAKGIKALSFAFDELIARIDTEDPLHLEELQALGLKSLFAMVEKAGRVLPNLMNAERISRGLPTELSASITYSETKIIHQTTDDLAQLLHGLGLVLDSAKETEGADEDEFDIDDAVIIDVDGEVIEEDLAS